MLIGNSYDMFDKDGVSFKVGDKVAYVTTCYKQGYLRTGIVSQLINKPHGYYRYYNGKWDFYWKLKDLPVKVSNSLIIRPLDPRCRQVTRGEYEVLKID